MPKDIIMENLIIEGTSSTPYIDCNTSGKIVISGRSLPENPLNFFRPLMEWAKNLTNDHVEIDIKFEYFNTSTSKVILDFLKIFEEKQNKGDFKVNWFYEEGDDDNFESGQLYKDEIKGINFDFIEYAEM